MICGGTVRKEERRLEAHGGRYFAADRLSVADLKVFVLIRHLKSGALDHVLPDRFAPKLVEHYERVKNDPRVKAYYAKHDLPTGCKYLRSPDPFTEGSYLIALPRRRGRCRSVTTYRTLRRR